MSAASDQQQQQQQQQQSGPPYVPHVAQNGGMPSISVDIPITAVFLFLYILGAIGHMTILQVNLKRGHKFLMSGLLFGFCMSRILTTTLRIGVINKPQNISLNIAAQIFLNAGVLIAYIVALILSQRLLRSYQPHIGWNRGLSVFLKVLYVLLGVSLALVIIFTNVMFYTLDATLRNDAMWIQRASSLYILLFVLVAVTMYLAAVLLPDHEQARDFGTGSIRTKKLITGFIIALCVLEAGFRMGTSWSPARPVDDPAWYQSKPAFYVFYFGVEIIIIYTLLITRFDQRFWIPNGSKKVTDYVRKEHHHQEKDLESELSTTGAAK